jgi:hypothetical protein
MDIHIQDEALFVVPASGALWAYDFGNERRVIREGNDEPADPPFQIAQVRVDDRDVLLVFFTLAPPSIVQQDKIRRLLAEHVGTRAVAFVLDQAPGYTAVVGSDADLVADFAAAAAVVRRCWGWDESQLFTITVDELEFTVALEFDGVWTAWPEPVTRRAVRARG